MIFLNLCTSFSWSMQGRGGKAKWSQYSRLSKIHEGNPAGQMQRNNLPSKSFHSLPAFFLACPSSKCYGTGYEVLGWKIPKRKLCATAYKDWGYSITYSGTLAVLLKKKKERLEKVPGWSEWRISWIWELIKQCIGRSTSNEAFRSSEKKGTPFPRSTCPTASLMAGHGTFREIDLAAA